MDDLTFALSVLCAFLDISKCWFMAPHSDYGNTIERSTSLSIAAWVQSEPMCFELYAGIGQRPQSFAKAACERRRVGSSPTVINISATVNVAIP